MAVISIVASTAVLRRSWSLAGFIVERSCSYKVGIMLRSAMFRMRPFWWNFYSYNRKKKGPPCGEPFKHTDITINVESAHIKLGNHPLEEFEIDLV